MYFCFSSWNHGKQKKVTSAEIRRKGDQYMVDGDDRMTGGIVIEEQFVLEVQILCELTLLSKKTNEPGHDLCFSHSSFFDRGDLSVCHSWLCFGLILKNPRFISRDHTIEETCNFRVCQKAQGTGFVFNRRFFLYILAHTFPMPKSWVKIRIRNVPYRFVGQTKRNTTFKSTPLVQISVYHFHISLQNTSSLITLSRVT